MILTRKSFLHIICLNKLKQVPFNTSTDTQNNNNNKSILFVCLIKQKYAVI